MTAEDRPRPGRPARETDHPLGRRLREQRQARGWTVRELALRLGLNESAAAYISQLEAGQKTPNERVAATLAEVFEDRSGVYGLWAQLGRRTDALTATRAIARLAEILKDPRLAESLRGIGSSTMISAQRARPAADAVAMRSEQYLVQQRSREIAQASQESLSAAAPRKTGLGPALRKLFGRGPGRSDRIKARMESGGANIHAAREQELYRAATPLPAQAAASLPAPGVGAEWVAMYLPRVPAVRRGQEGRQVRELRILPDELEPERYLSHADAAEQGTVWVDGAGFQGDDPGLWFVSRVSRSSNAGAYGLRVGELIVMQSARRPSRPHSLCLVRVSGRLRWELVAFNGRHSIVLDDGGESFRVLDGEDVHLVAIALARLETESVR
jgi:transcriptional regulator with XRE-family HTH domain